MRKNEHPSCGCNACKRGAHSAAGHFTHTQVSRKLRRRYRQALRNVAPDDVVQIIVPTPYTD